MTEEQEQEVSEELGKLADLSGDIQEDHKRLRALHKKGKLTENLAAEVLDTVMSLLSQLATATVEHAAMMEDWAEGVDEAVEEGSLAEGAVGGLDPEEAELFGWLFTRLSDFVKVAKANEDLPKEIQQGMLEIEVKLQAAFSVLEKYAEDEDGEEEQELEAGEGNEGSEPDDGDGDDGDDGE